MAKNIILQWLQRYAAHQRALGIERCNDWGGKTVVELAPDSLVDVGCGDGSLLFRYLKKSPREFYGVEGSPQLKAKAEERGLKVPSCDLNGRWPFEDNKFDVVFSSQVIEHLHNTRLFAEEAFRVLKPGGHGSHHVRKPFQLVELLCVVHGLHAISAHADLRALPRQSTGASLQ